MRWRSFPSRGALEVRRGAWSSPSAACSDGVYHLTGGRKEARTARDADGRCGVRSQLCGRESYGERGQFRACRPAQGARRVEAAGDPAALRQAASLTSPRAQEAHARSRSRPGRAAGSADRPAARPAPGRAPPCPAEACLAARASTETTSAAGTYPGTTITRALRRLGLTAHETRARGVIHESGQVGQRQHLLDPFGHLRAIGSGT